MAQVWCEGQPIAILDNEVSLLGHRLVSQDLVLREATESGSILGIRVEVELHLPFPSTERNLVTQVQLGGLELWSLHLVDEDVGDDARVVARIDDGYNERCTIFALLKSAITESDT